jgi:predicted transposase YbfD/YdcC
MSLSPEFLSHFEPLEDPRRPAFNLRHELTDILAITILATICGADSWIEIEAFATSKKDWLTTFLELPNGIPSHDTLERVFASLNPTQFEHCFQAWVSTLRIEPDEREIIAVDGKTLRASHNWRKAQKPLHMVSAWAVANSLCLGQVLTEAKSNEIEAMPRLLKMLEVKGCIVTTDAMGCQHAIAAQIIEQGADYVLTLKDNQPTLAESVAKVFTVGDATVFAGMHYLKQIEKVYHEHGRVETRKYTLVSCKDGWAFGTMWPGLKSIGRIDVVRTVDSRDVTYSTRYFLTSLTYRQMPEFMRAVRQHWQIEINLHWSLDVSFGEDQNRVRHRCGAANLAIVRRIALNLLKQDKTLTKGISAKRKTAGWNHDYLAKILNQKPKP